MKKLIIVYFLFLSFFSKGDEILGKHVYTTDSLSESIELLKNNKFIYRINRDNMEYELKGRYTIHDSLLYLEEYPCWEIFSYEERYNYLDLFSIAKENIIISAREAYSEHRSRYIVLFKMHIIKNDGRDYLFSYRIPKDYQAPRYPQYTRGIKYRKKYTNVPGATQVNNESLKGFYIFDVLNKLQSPIYYKKDSSITSIQLIIDSSLLQEQAQQPWLIKDGNIIPWRLRDKTYSNYYLKKN